jgi:hypothetical protein
MSSLNEIFVRDRYELLEEFNQLLKEKIDVIIISTPNIFQEFLEEITHAAYNQKKTIFIYKSKISPKFKPLIKKMTLLGNLYLVKSDAAVSEILAKLKNNQKKRIEKLIIEDNFS